MRNSIILTQGAYGDVSAYYGTVEQQGRLALHLHMLIWLAGNLTPQEMRTKILDPNSDWQRKLVSWLESCVMGEYFLGTQNEIMEKVKEKSKSPDYADPTEVFPTPPPAMCSLSHEEDNKCKKCIKFDKWWVHFEETVDDLITKCNIHSCARGTNRDGTKSKVMTYKGCRDNEFGKCKARFPRPIYDQTEVDPETGAINIKKGEAWINFITHVVTYLLLCNTDITCMWSGTALKAVIVYVTDYITKTSLKTHVIFEVIKGVFDRHSCILGSSLPEKEKARQLMTKMVNALTVRMEMGAPMVCMYLLGNPDHYTNHRFVPFYWKSYVNEAKRPWMEEDEEKPERLLLMRTKNRVVGYSAVYDYTYRPDVLGAMCLYDWAQQCQRKKIPENRKGKKSKHANKKLHNVHNTLDDEVQSDDSDHESDELSDNSSCNSHDSGQREHEDHPVYRKLPKNMHHFMTGHPLANTHALMVSPDNGYIVTNFIGGPLPRCDQGDQDYYCMTMLTLFKPWRSGTDLKTKDETWDQTFNNHLFSAKHLQVMKNFNIKYECLDARDDYRAQLKSGDHSILPFLTDMADDENEPDLSLTEQDPFVSETIQHLQDTLAQMKLGKSELKRKREAEEICAIMKQVGWSNYIPLSQNDTSSFTAIKPTLELSASQWKNIIQMKKQDVINQRSQRIPGEKTVNVHGKSKPNEVKVVDKSYLVNKCHSTELYGQINDLCSQFSLNEEQDCAFKIIANHVVTPNSEHLKMYIGGMGGTGKTRVITALSNFFAARNESYRFISVAPTGSAAALLGGSTYHSVFGINDHVTETASKVLSQVHSRLEGVDYIFLDEVSMLSCYDMYKISSHLAKAMNNDSVAFGGMNMIFAGDFAQLPPPMGGENVSLYSRTIGDISTKLRSQQEAMGRALWHQITTVVILRQNMRQNKLTEKDQKLRTALENMRYKDCTPQDITFLRSCITSNLPGKQSICQSQFKFASIITAKNVQRDEINRLGCIKFAQETGQELDYFFSDDAIKSVEDEKPQKKYKRSKRKRWTTITEDIQKALWELPHSSADKHVPGKLPLCIGMPIIIKCNAATELCITNGQEGTVVGWKPSLGKLKQKMLDIVYIKLRNPPSKIQLDGLPENVVPLTHSTIPITCKLPDDTKITIVRTQVEILPNFAMTDFAAQGKTRPFNPVDLNNCRSHQAYYTALSRSASADGTVILQGIHPKKITGKASGALRQEFRDLELLDEITMLRYHSKLPSSVEGAVRNTLIASYRACKGMTYVPRVVHHSIRWNKADPMLDPIQSDSTSWRIIDKIDTSMQNEKDIIKTRFVPAQGSIPIQASKRKRIDDILDYNKKTAKKKNIGTSATSPASQIILNIDSLMPEGFEWHQNSCPYDALLSIVHCIWTTDQPIWTQCFAEMNHDLAGQLVRGFHKHQDKKVTLESVRDNFRRALDALFPTQFAWASFSSPCDIMPYLFSMPITTTATHLECDNGHTIPDVIRINDTCCVMSAGRFRYKSVQDWMTLLKESTRHVCDECLQSTGTPHNLYRHSKFTHILPLIALDFCTQQIQIDHTITVRIDELEVGYILSGVMYYGNSHFTSRIIQANRMVWFHDGIATGKKMTYEGKLDNLNNNLDLTRCGSKTAVGAIYIKA